MSCLHWSDEIVAALAKRGPRHIIETGTSISGIPHVGNASDVIRGDCVRKSAVHAGLTADLIWVADDSDPFRRVPKGMEELGGELGKPVKDIPGFVDGLAGPFIADLARFGVNPIVYSGTDLYRSGALLGQIKTALEKRGEIRDILNEYRREPLPAEWIPWTPICAACGRISTTKVTGLDGLKAAYVCEAVDVSGSQVEGCGHEGVSDVSEGLGKLPWRVEWAARWHHFKVTCEPFGKEHATKGGSYDTSSRISKVVYGWEPPVPVIYEFFTLNGAKISSSAGNVITLSDWLGIVEPEVLKYFMYKRLQKQRDINLRTLPNLVDEYDEAERIHFSRQEGDASLARMYSLAQVDEDKYLNVPYTLCAVLSQVTNVQQLKAKVEAMGYTGFDPVRLKARVELAGNWVMKYGPDYLRFRLNSVEGSKTHYERLSDAERTCLRQLAGLLDGSFTPEEYHKRIYETARANEIPPKELFKAIYMVLIGKQRGPKAAAFILTLGASHVKPRFGL
jgi:lysyl-tRNA synthetase class 1